MFIYWINSGLKSYIPYVGVKTVTQFPEHGMKNLKMSCKTCDSHLKTRKSRWQRSVVMYCAMVAVSTAAIFFLEHATIANAFRTAVVAAIGKTLAANWVTEFFQ